MNTLDFTKFHNVSLEGNQVKVEGKLIYDGTKIGAKRLYNLFQAPKMSSIPHWKLTAKSYVYHTIENHLMVDGLSWFSFEDETAAKSWVKMLRGVVARLY